MRKFLDPALFTTVINLPPNPNIGNDGVIDDGTRLNVADGESFTIATPIETLSGILADGSSFSFDRFFGGGAFTPGGATLTVRLSSILGDVNLDAGVDISDIPAFIAILISGGYQVEADCNQDGVVDFSDIPVFIEILLNT